MLIKGQSLSWALFEPPIKLQKCHLNIISNIDMVWIQNCMYKWKEYADNYSIFIQT